MTREGTLEGGWLSSSGAGASSSCTLWCCCGTSTGGSAQGQSRLWMVISQPSLGNSVPSATARRHFSSTSSGRSSAAHNGHGHPVSPNTAPEREHREKHHPKHLLIKAKASEKERWPGQETKCIFCPAPIPSHTRGGARGAHTPPARSHTNDFTSHATTSGQSQLLKQSHFSSTVRFLAELMACTTLGTKRRAGREAARERIKTLFPLPERDL